MPIELESFAATSGSRLFSIAFWACSDLYDNNDLLLKASLINLNMSSPTYKKGNYFTDIWEYSGEHEKIFFYMGLFMESLRPDRFGLMSNRERND